MIYKALLLCLLIPFVLLFEVPCYGGAPVWNDLGTSNTLREVMLMGNPLRCWADATDPDGHSLVYQWRIVSDPTGKASFDGDVASRVVSIKFPWVSPVLEENPVGESVLIEVTVNHADTALYGDVALSRVLEARIIGVNQPPQPVIIVDPVSSPTNRILEGDGVSFTSDSSIDPDNSGMRHEWVGMIASGSFAQPLVIFGTEGTGSGFTVPGLITDTAQVSVALVLIDGLHKVSQTTYVYIKKRDDRTARLRASRPRYKRASPRTVWGGPPTR